MLDYMVVLKKGNLMSQIAHIL